MNNKSGFTLIELIVVILIIGVLVLLATPKFLNYIELAKETRIAHDVKVAENMAIADYVSTGEWPFNINRPIEDEDLLEMVESGKAYTKNGLVNKDGSEKEESIVRNNIAYADVVDTGKSKNVNILEYKYFILPEKYIKTKVGSKLKGYFILNNEGSGVYLDEVEDREEIDQKWKDDHLGDKFEDEKYKYSVIELEDETTGSLYIGLEVNGLSEEYKIKNRNHPAIYALYHVNDIPLEKKYEGQNLKVIRIGDYAFEVLSNRLTGKAPRLFTISYGKYEDDPDALIIHRNIREIGKKAFSYDSSSHQSHVDSHYINKLDLSKATSLKVIEDYAFIGLRDRNLKINSSIEYIGDNAFATNRTAVSLINYGISSTELDLSKADNLKYIGKNAFSFRNIGLEETSGKIFIPKNVLKIDNGAFSGNRIKDLDLSKAESLEYIGAAAFGNVDTSKHNNVIKDGKGPVILRDREIYIPRNVKYIGRIAFFPQKSSSNTDEHVVDYGVNIINIDLSREEFKSRRLDGLKLLEEDYMGPGKYTWNEVSSIWDYEE